MAEILWPKVAAKSVDSARGAHGRNLLCSDRCLVHTVRLSAQGGLFDALARLPLGEHGRSLAPGGQDSVGLLEGCAHFCTQEGDEGLDMILRNDENRGDASEEGVLCDESCQRQADRSSEGHQSTHVAIRGLCYLKLIFEVGVHDEGA